MDENGDARNAVGAAGERYRAVSGTLYVVATPVGNLRDLTLRALDVLASVDVVAAEDTRVTSVLLRHYGIAARPIALHEHNESTRANEIVAMLSAGSQRCIRQRRRHARRQRSRRPARSEGP
jgi:16S rRNA (cytidine1402-2'-O)-methyltransferase